MHLCVFAYLPLSMEATVSKLSRRCPDSEGAGAMSILATTLPLSGGLGNGSSLDHAGLLLSLS